MSPGCWATPWTGAHRGDRRPSPASGVAPRQVTVRRTPAKVEVPPPADDIWSAAHSRVAQLVEQPDVNRRVAGSSPASGASQPSAPQSLSHAPFFPSGAGDGLVTVSGSLSGVGHCPRPVEHRDRAVERILTLLHVFRRRAKHRGAELE